MGIKDRLNNNPKLKELTLSLISSKQHPKPRLWVRWFVNPFFHKKGKKAKISHRGSRIDVFPWHSFNIGNRSVIEDQCIINNGAGDIIIGENSLIGIGSIITGPVTIGNNILFGQRVFITGFNHGYRDIDTHIKDQPLDRRPSSVGDDTFIGTDAVVLPGVAIGKRCQVGAGSVVTKDIPDFSIAVGNPARIIKRYDTDTKEWVPVYD